MGTLNKAWMSSSFYLLDCSKPGILRDFDRDSNHHKKTYTRGRLEFSLLANSGDVITRAGINANGVAGFDESRNLNFDSGVDSNLVG